MFAPGAGSLAARKKKKAEVKEEETADGSTSSSSSSSTSSSSSETKTTPALLRIQKDLTDLEIPENVTLVKKDEYNLSFIIQPNSGLWTGGLFEFTFSFPSKYPFDGPKVTCIDPIYHPNIDLEGGVCVNVLRPWKPTYSTQIVLFGLLFLFTHPNPNDPLNNEAAKEMRENPQLFAKNVVSALKGLKVQGFQFPKNRGKGPFASA